MRVGAHNIVRRRVSIYVRICLSVTCGSVCVQTALFLFFIFFIEWPLFLTYLWSNIEKILTVYFNNCVAATMEIFSVGAGFVKIAGVETDLFLTIDDTGILRGTVKIYYSSVYVCTCVCM